jgi:hypothetical protein
MTYTESDLFRFAQFFKNFSYLRSVCGTDYFSMQGNDDRLYSHEDIVELFNQTK